MFGQFISDLMNYSFLQNALITSIIVGVTCGVIGSFITLKGMSLMGDAISHAVLPGVAISYMLGINFFYGAVVSGLLTALGINYVSQKSRIKVDSAIGIVFSAFFAVGVILMGKVQTAIDLSSILFGNVLTVSGTDRHITLIVGIVVVVTVFIFYKELLITTFDPTMAKAFGLPVEMINYAIMIMLTLVSVASLQTVGVILVVALIDYTGLHCLFINKQSVQNDWAKCFNRCDCCDHRIIFQFCLQSSVRSCHCISGRCYVCSGLFIFAQTRLSMAKN